MRLSEKQAIILLDHFKDTLGIMNMGSYTPEQRRRIYDEIINQQSNEPVELDNEKVG